MEFTVSDKAYLLGKVYGGDKKPFEDDLPQMERAVSATTYTLYEGNKSKGSIPRKRAIELLGREVWLSGISRSAFHWTAGRPTADGKEVVIFDSSKLFR